MTLQEKIKEFIREIGNIPDEEAIEELEKHFIYNKNGVGSFLVGCEYAYTIILGLLGEYKIDKEL